MLKVEMSFGCAKCGGPVIAHGIPAHTWACIMCDELHYKPHREGAHKEKPPTLPWWKRLFSRRPHGH